MLLQGIKRGFFPFILLAAFSSSGWAVPISNPFPTRLGPDIDGSGLFQHGNRLVSIELFDTLDQTGGSGSEFGFYFSTHPGTLIPIFEADDTTVFPTVSQSAVINFGSGLIQDEQSLEIDTFTSRGLTDIGFYWRQALPGSIPIFTQALLNPGGADYAGAFPFLSNPLQFAILFQIPQTGRILGINIVRPLVPSPIPIPGAAGLWLLGIAGLALFRRLLARSSV